MNDDDQDDHGMRIVRGRGRRAKTSSNPRTLHEAEAGSVVLIAVRVCAHLAGPAHGVFDHVLCRPFDLRAKRELYTSDLGIAHAERVPCYPIDDDEKE